MPGIFDYIEDEGLRQKAEASHKTAMDEINSTIQSKVDEAVSGLKTKNQELLDEKKRIQQTLKNFENIDPEKARDALKFLNENEDAQLIKDGRIDELIEKRTSTMRSDHEAKMGEMAAALKESMEEGSKYKGLFHSKTIDDALRAAAIKAKVLPEALEDILLRGRGLFSLDKDHSVEARDKDGKLRKTDDDKILTPDLWVLGLKESCPHFWPRSQGAGAYSGLTGDVTDTEKALADAASRGDTAAYRKLRSRKN